MPRVAKLLSFAPENASGAVYTVPAEKFVIANVHASNDNTQSVHLLINGKIFEFGSMQQAVFNGIVLPAGSTIQVISNGSGNVAIVTGFEYDAGTIEVPKVFSLGADGVNGALYTVPPGKHIIANLLVSDDDTQTMHLEVNGSLMDFGSNVYAMFPGLVFPTGTTLRVNSSGSGNSGLLSGFEYSN